jgi:hypothetical protein
MPNDKILKSKISLFRYRNYFSPDLILPPHTPCFLVGILYLFHIITDRRLQVFCFCPSLQVTSTFDMNITHNSE